MAVAQIELNMTAPERSAVPPDALEWWLRSALMVRIPRLVVVLVVGMDRFDGDVFDCRTQHEIAARVYPVSDALRLGVCVVWSVEDAAISVELASALSCIAIIFLPPIVPNLRRNSEGQTCFASVIQLVPEKRMLISLRPPNVSHPFHPCVSSA